MDQVEELQVLMEFFKEGAISAEEVDLFYAETLFHIEDLEFRNMLSDEGDNMSAVLQITAGAGGTESCDWASLLCKRWKLCLPRRRGSQKRCNRKLESKRPTPPTKTQELKSRRNKITDQQLSQKPPQGGFFVLYYLCSGRAQS
jgi:hypothetical protein